MRILHRAIDGGADQSQFRGDGIVAAHRTKVETLQVGRKLVEFLVGQSEDVLHRELDVLESRPLRVREDVRARADTPSHRKTGHRCQCLGGYLLSESDTRQNAAGRRVYTTADKRDDDDDRVPAGHVSDS